MDLEKTDPLLKADGQGSQIHLKIEKELSPRPPGIAPLRPESQLAFMSLPSYRQDIIPKPIYANPPSLPPSSPPALSSEENDAAGISGEDDVEADPFGFLAAEKKLKDRKPRFPFITSYPESVLQEYGSFGEEDISVKAFAGQSSTLNKRSVSTASGEQKRMVPSLSPSPSLFTNRPHDPSSPCRKAVGRKSNKRRKMIRGVEKGKGKDTINEHSESKFTALDETFLPKHSKRDVQENSDRTKRKARRTSGKRARLCHLTKKRDSRTEVLSHLNDEERKKFEREREERITYYRWLDSYCVAKENVWVV